MATGSSYRRLGVPGEERLTGGRRLLLRRLRRRLLHRPGHRRRRRRGQRPQGSPLPDPLRPRA
ncbi:MAG: hypothetical protein M0C28_05315 [Candidatus Moduliflexus flocculans]|nr:hypothetical protein [Candidatus Moduliflexus flocculans]